MPKTCNDPAIRLAMDQTAVGRALPDRTARVRIQRQNSLSGRSPFIGGSGGEVLERARSHHYQIQALVGSHPDGTPGGSRQSCYTIVYERVRALRIVLQMLDVTRERVNDVDPG